MRIFRSIVCAVALFSFSACSSASLSEEYCERLDSCNNLRGSVSECTQDVDAILDRLSQNQRDEVEYAFEQCLERPSCDGFSACVGDL